MSKLNFAALKNELVSAGMAHLAGRMEAAVAQETKALSESPHIFNARREAELALAGHIELWMDGTYGDVLTPDAVFSQRPVVIQAWAIAEKMKEAAGSLFTGIPPKDASCPSCGRPGAGFCADCDAAAARLPAADSL